MVGRAFRALETRNLILSPLCALEHRAEVPAGEPSRSGMGAKVFERAAEPVVEPD